MIILVVLAELFVCALVGAVLTVGSGDDNLFGACIEIWLACAVLQLAIHYLPKDRRTQFSLVLAMIALLVASVTIRGVDALPYFHQALFIATVGTLPQLCWNWHGQAKTWYRPALGLAALFAIPLGFVGWSIANIPIVKINAYVAAQGSPYCIFVSDGRIFTSGYHQTSNAFDLSGWRMVSGRGGGGSGNCCQWDFHALLVTSDKTQFNWSYKSQSFERVSDRTQRLMHLPNLACLPSR